MESKDFNPLLLLCGLVFMAACGGGGDDDDEDDDCTGGFITIDTIDPGQAGSVTVTGTAFASDSWFCDFSGTCFPGVEVTYDNLNSGEAGMAASHFSGFTGRHSWSAAVLLISGENRIRFRAEEVSQGDVFCTETVAIQSARSRVLQTYPANLAEKVHQYSAIAAKIEGKVDSAKIDERSIIVSDNFGVAISGKIEIEFDADKQFSTLIFIPDYPLAPAAQYRVVLKANIFSSGEGRASRDFSWVFTTWNN